MDTKIIFVGKGKILLLLLLREALDYGIQCLFFVDKKLLLMHETYCNSEKRLYNAIYSNENKADVTSIRL